MRLYTWIRWNGSNVTVINWRYWCFIPSLHELGWKVLFWYLLVFILFICLLRKHIMVRHNYLLLKFICLIIISIVCVMRNFIHHNWWFIIGFFHDYWLACWLWLLCIICKWFDAASTSYNCCFKTGIKFIFTFADKIN